MCGQVDQVDGSEDRWMSGLVDKTVVATCISMSYVNRETSNRFVQEILFFDFPLQL